MDSKQNNNRKLQPMEDEQLPQELQWENMEAGILLKMEELESSIPVDNNKRPRRRLLLGFLFLGTLVSSLYLLSYEPGSENTLDLGSLAALPIPTESTCVEEDDKLSHPEQMSVSNDEQIIAGKAKISQADVPQYNEQQSLTVDSPDEADRLSANAVEVLETQAGDTHEPVSSKVDKQATNTKQEIALPLTMPNADKTPTTDSPNASLLAPVEGLVDHQVMAPIVSQTLKQETALPIPVLPIMPSHSTAKTRASQIWLTGGASWWNAGYGRTKPERAELEQAILSYQGQFSYVKPLKKDWFVLAGLQYQKLESRLDWNIQIEDFQLTLEDTIIQVQTNALTGEATPVRGDITLTVPAERKVRHFNSFSFVQLAMGIGKTWGKGRWQSHLLVGGVASLSVSRQGRTVYQGALVDYDSPSANLSANKLSFGAMLSGGLSYRITNHLGVMTVVQYQHSISNWSTEQGITMRPRILNWSLGVNYSL